MYNGQYAGPSMRSTCAFCPYVSKNWSALTWLRCETELGDCSKVASLHCAVCRQYENRIRGSKHFSEGYLRGSTNLRKVNVIDHANSHQHKSAMDMLYTDQGQSRKVQSSAAITKGIERQGQLDPARQEKMIKMFDVCYWMAKQDIAFQKYPAILALEERHGVDFGPSTSYRTKDSAAQFSRYIAETQRQEFLEVLKQAKFVSFLMDGSVDSGNLEDELILILFCQVDSNSMEVQTHVRYFSLQVPERADASGLIACLGNALATLNVDDILSATDVLSAADHGFPVIIGCGTDGAAVNIGEQNGMRGRLQHELPWMFWAWCYAHQLELACKDAFTSTLFTDISEMLMRLYYVYEKSAKKTRELLNIVDDLREAFDLTARGDKPLRSQGTRWITHKRAALQRVVDRYGAYIAHMTTLVEDRSVPAADRARLKGYLRKWEQGRILIGCALYIDALRPASLLSRCLQMDNLDIIEGMKAILDARSSLLVLRDKDPRAWPSLRNVLGAISTTSEYQGAALSNYTSETVAKCIDQAKSDLLRLEGELLHRLEWSDVEMLQALVHFADTASWQDRGEGTTDIEGHQADTAADKIHAAASHIAKHFQEPFESQGGSVHALRDEVEEVVAYAQKHLGLERENHRAIWYKLHVSPGARKWPNVLLLCQLVFSLPISNGQVERAFSALKNVKTIRRASLQPSTLDNLLELKIAGPPLDGFSAAASVNRWWSDCRTTRRPEQGPRKQYSTSARSAASSHEVATTPAPTAAQQLDSWVGSELKMSSEASRTPSASAKSATEPPQRTESPERVQPTVTVGSGPVGIKAPSRKQLTISQLFSRSASARSASASARSASASERSASLMSERSASSTSGISASSVSGRSASSVASQASTSRKADVCLECGKPSPPVLRVCKGCGLRYHHMCQSSDEDGKLCNSCYHFS